MPQVIPPHPPDSKCEPHRSSAHASPLPTAAACRSRDEAFRIGADIARQVTAAHPPPVTLRMEKVYHPCILQTKKRYVGFMFERPGQAVPTFDAKGIETIRRDQCPAVAKMEERALRLLFTTRDLSEVGVEWQREAVLPAAAAHLWPVRGKVAASQSSRESLPQSMSRCTSRGGCSFPGTPNPGFKPPAA